MRLPLLLLHVNHCLAMTTSLPRPRPPQMRQKWYFCDYKLIKVFGKDNRVAFQCKGTAYTRGVTLSKAAFLKIEDVTIVPGMRLELESNCFLVNLGGRIHLIRYCLTRDKVRCQGGFFYFTRKEWQHFLEKLEPAIRRCLLTL